MGKSVRFNSFTKIQTWTYKCIKNLFFKIHSIRFQQKSPVADTLILGRTN